MNTSPTIGLTQLGQIAINVHDLPRALAFYRDTLGMKFLFQAGTMAFFDCGGLRLMLGIPEQPEFDHPSSILYFKVPDIERYYCEFTTRGVQFLSKPALIAKMPAYDLWMCFFKDSEGNTLSLYSEVTHSTEGSNA
ncbi:MAG: VOC family protein [Verrucomicrobiota bacterium]